MRNKYIVPIPSVTGSFKKALFLSLVPFMNVWGENFFLRWCSARLLPRVSLTETCLRLVFGFVSSVSFQPKEPKSNLLRWPKPRWSSTLYRFIINKPLHGGKREISSPPHYSSMIVLTVITSFGNVLSCLTFLVHFTHFYWRICRWTSYGFSETGWRPSPHPLRRDLVLMLHQSRC